MTIWDRFPCEGTGITCDKMPKERALMTLAQAKSLLAIAATHKPGTIREEFIKEAEEVMKNAR